MEKNQNELEEARRELAELREALASGGADPIPGPNGSEVSDDFEEARLTETPDTSRRTVARQQMVAAASAGGMMQQRK